MMTAQTKVMSFMSDRTLWLLTTVSRGWPWEERERMADRLGTHVAWARGEGFTRFVLVHGAYGLDPLGRYKHNPPRSDSMARSIWVDEWGFEDVPHPADFETYGRAAGPIRNADMVQSIVSRLMVFSNDAARCEAFIFAESAGATGTADLAERAGIPTRRHKLGKAEPPARRARPARVASVPSQPRVVAKVVQRKSRAVVSDAVAVVPSNVPGPCGRCGRMSYLCTDDVLFQGDGFCVYWDEQVQLWRAGCGTDRPLRRPVPAAGGSVASPAAVLPTVRAGAGRTALSGRRAS